MKKGLSFISFLFCILILGESLYGYQVPPVNLGFTSFLDGGPLGPLKPGFVFQEYVQYYHSDDFLDQNGRNLPGMDGTDFDYWVSLNQLLWTTKYKFLCANIGFDFILPVVLSSHVDRNPLLIRTNGAGFGDFVFGAYLQWEVVMKNEKPFFVTFLELDVSFPTGKYSDKYAINPGANVYSVFPFWAATLFVTPKISASWRIHYLWCSEDPDTKLQAGQTIFLNYALGYSFSEKVVGGLNGYYLKQLENTKLDGKSVPNSQERVLGIGPGFVYLPTKTLQFYVNLNFETLVQNRTEGTRLTLRAVKIS